MIWLIISLLIAAADQLVKYLILSNAQIGETVFSLKPIVEITYVQNTGAAFSMLEGKVWILGIVSALFCAAVVAYWIIKKPKHPLLCTSISMIFAGALGNAIDRLARGFVVDYIDAAFINFPVFNIADMAIVIGAGLFILYEILYDRN